MPSLREMLSDPEFQSLSKADQEDLIFKFTQKKSDQRVGTFQGQGENVPESSLGRPGLKKNAWDAIKEKTLDLPAGKVPLLGQEETVGSRLAGLGIGGATGGMFGGVPGALVGGGMGALFPPHNTGEAVAQMTMGPYGKAGAGVLQGMKGPISRTLMAGLLGEGGLQAAHATTELTNRAMDNQPAGQAQPGVNGGKVPMQQGPVFNDPTQGNNWLQHALATVPGMASESFLRGPVENHPVVKSNKFTNEQLGPTKLGEMDNLQSLNPGQEPGLEQALQAGREKPAGIKPTYDQIEAQTAQKTANLNKQQAIAEQQKFLDTTNAGQTSRQAKVKAQTALLKMQVDQELAQTNKSISDLKLQGATDTTPELIQARAKLRELNRSGESKNLRQRADDKVTQLELQDQENAAQQIQQKAIADQQKVAAGQQIDTNNVEVAQANASKANTTRNKKSLSFQAEKLDTENRLLDQSLTDLRGKAGTWEAMNPAIRDIAWKSTDTKDLINNLSSPSTTEASLSAYKSHLESLPNGKDHVVALQDAMTKDFFQKAYNPQTKTLDATELFKPDGAYSYNKLEALFGKGKAIEFQTALNDINKWAQGQHASAAEKVGQYAFNRGVWLTLEGVLMAKNVIGAGTGLAAGFVTIAYPKLIKELLTNKTTADWFHKFATGTTPAQQSLTNFPRVAAMLKGNSTPTPVPMVIPGQPTASAPAQTQTGQSASPPQ